MRGDLAGQGFAPCGALDAARDGRAVRLAGLVLVRQKPGSAKGTMFITPEDETGVANLIVWPTVFERHRRLVLTAGVIGVVGRVQRQGIVVHVVAERLVNLTAPLRQVGGLTTADAAFPLPHGRGDEAKRGGPDARDGNALGRKAREIYVLDLALGSGIKVPTRDFR